MNQREPLIPGHHVENAGRYHKTCKTCHEGVMMARVRDGRSSTWRALEPGHIDQDGRRFFRRHQCGRKNQGPTERTPPQRGLF